MNGEQGAEEKESWLGTAQRQSRLRQATISFPSGPPRDGFRARSKNGRDHEQSSKFSVNLIRARRTLGSSRVGCVVSPSYAGRARGGGHRDELGGKFGNLKCSQVHLQVYSVLRASSTGGSRRRSFFSSRRQNSVRNFPIPSRQCFRLVTQNSADVIRFSGRKAAQFHRSGGDPSMRSSRVWSSEIGKSRVSPGRQSM